MKTRVLYHKFMVYLPVILILLLIVLIYSVYIIEYIIPLLAIQDPTKYAFNTSSTHSTAQTKGTILLILTIIFLILFLISFFRTVFTDPGYFPSPIDLEYRIVKKNIKHPELVFNLNCDHNNNSNINISEADEQVDIFDNKKNVSRFKILNRFNEQTYNGPLTFSESLNIRDKLNTCSDEPVIHNKKEKDHYLIDASGYNNVTNFEDDKGNQSDAKLLLKQKGPLAVCNENDPLYDETEALFNNFSNVDLMRSSLCANCLRWKLERSHHCRHCGRCILKMDHHCPWLANCIGFHNYKYFCLLHLYGLLSTLIISFSYWEVILSHSLNYETHMAQIAFSCFVYVSNLSLMCFLAWLFIVNVKLTFTNQTVIEQSDRERFPSNKTINVYDLGYFENFKAVYGKNFFVWFIPFFPNYEGNGLIFKKNQESLFTK